MYILHSDTVKTVHPIVISIFIIITIIITNTYMLLWGGTIIRRNMHPYKLINHG